MTTTKKFCKRCYQDECTRICPYCDTFIEAVFMRSFDPDENQDVAICCPKCYQRIGSISTNGILYYFGSPEPDKLPKEFLSDSEDSDVHEKLDINPEKTA